MVIFAMLTRVRLLTLHSVSICRNCLHSECGHYPPVLAWSLVPSSVQVPREALHSSSHVLRSLALRLGKLISSSVPKAVDLANCSSSRLPHRKQCTLCCLEIHCQKACNDYKSSRRVYDQERHDEACVGAQNLNMTNLQSAHRHPFARVAQSSLPNSQLQHSLSQKGDGTLRCKIHAANRGAI